MKISASKYIKIGSLALFAVYIAYLIFLTFFDHSYGRGTVHRYINAIPFNSIIECVKYTDINIIAVNILGNIAAFVPMGFLPPIPFKRLSKFRNIFLAIIAATFSIEILQFITGAGITDIDDVILNTLGGILGYLMFVISKNMWIKWSNSNQNVN